MRSNRLLICRRSIARTIQVWQRPINCSTTTAPRSANRFDVTPRLYLPRCPIGQHRLRPAKVSSKPAYLFQSFSTAGVVPKRPTNRRDSFSHESNSRKRPPTSRITTPVCARRLPPCRIPPLTKSDARNRCHGMHRSAAVSSNSSSSIGRSI